MIDSIQTLKRHSLARQGAECRFHGRSDRILTNITTASRMSGVLVSLRD
jgi:hypothetical protein